MKEAVVILTLLGCNDAETECTYINSVPQTYATETECFAASEAAFESAQNEEYPVMMAKCEVQTAVVEAQPAPAPEAVTIAAPSEEEGWVKRRLFDPVVNLGKKTGEVAGDVAEGVVDGTKKVVTGTKKVIQAVNPLKLIQE